MERLEVSSAVRRQRVNNSRGVQVTDFYGFILKRITLYFLATLNVNNQSVLGHADVSEDADS